MGKLDTVKSEIESVLADGQKRIELFQTRAEKEAEANKAATSLAEHAFSNADIDTFSAAQNDAKKAGDAAALYAKQVERLKNEPLLSQAEYENYLADIMADLAARVEADKKKISALAVQIETIANAEAEYLNKGNELLQKLQHEVMKDDACVQAANGQRVHVDQLEKKFNDWSVISFASKTTEAADNYGFKKAE